MGRIERFLETRYVLGDRKDDERFRDIPRIRHASSIGKCQRQNWYKLKHDKSNEYSPYFELGNRFEDIYGAVLVSQFDDSFDADDVANMENHELIEQSDVVLQDVSCNIQLGEGHDSEDVIVTGESDWVVMYDGEKPVSHVELFEDGTRRVEYTDGQEQLLEEDETTGIRLVIETKTSSIKWRKKYGHKFEHELQVGTYMWAFDAQGEIVYMERDDLSEKAFEFTRDEDREQTIEFRALELHRRLLMDEPPDANPPRDNVCKYCDFKDQCKVTGGSRWEDDFESIEAKRR